MIGNCMVVCWRRYDEGGGGGTRCSTHIPLLWIYQCQEGRSWC
jgi:hypothetical protein